MGTNFFLDNFIYDFEDGLYVPDDQTGRDHMDPAGHLGKRSAAGYYCWDCGQTLCQGGDKKVHHGKSSWWDSCPKCGKSPVAKDKMPRSMALELGFAAARGHRPSGVAACSSLSWCHPPMAAKAFIESQEIVSVTDEYGRKMTGLQFLAMVQTNCPIQLSRMVGKWFA